MLRAISLIALLAGCTTAQERLNQAWYACNGDVQCQQLAVAQAQLDMAEAQRRSMAFGMLSGNLAHMSAAMSQPAYAAHAPAYQWNTTGAGIGACYGGSVGTC